MKVAKFDPTSSYQSNLVAPLDISGGVGILKSLLSNNVVLNDPEKKHERKLFKDIPKLKINI